VAVVGLAGAAVGTKLAASAVDEDGPAPCRHAGAHVVGRVADHDARGESSPRSRQPCRSIPAAACAGQLLMKLRLRQASFGMVGTDVDRIDEGLRHSLQPLGFVSVELAPREYVLCGAGLIGDDPLVIQLR